MLERSVGVKTFRNEMDLMGRVREIRDSFLCLYNESENVRVWNTVREKRATVAPRAMRLLK